MGAKLRSFWHEEDGQALSEYATIIMVVGLAAIAVLVAFSGKIKDWFLKYQGCVDGDQTVCPSDSASGGSGDATGSNDSGTGE